MAALWRNLCRLATSAPVASLLRLPGTAAGASPHVTTTTTAAVSRRPLHLLCSCARVSEVAVAPQMSKVSLLTPSLPSQTSLLTPAACSLVLPRRSYKVWDSVKLRCSGCYFVRRQGRLFVECKLKPRHKQMQIMAKRKLFRDDYSKGDVVRALHWKHRTDRFYRMGNNHYSKHNWLDGKLGRTV